MIKVLRVIVKYNDIDATIEWKTAMQYNAKKRGKTRQSKAKSMVECRAGRRIGRQVECRTGKRTVHGCR